MQQLLQQQHPRLFVRTLRASSRVRLHRVSLAAVSVYAASIAPLHHASNTVLTQSTAALCLSQCTAGLNRIASSFTLITQSTNWLFANATVWCHCVSSRRAAL